MRVWPLAALAVYLVPAGTFPYHAFQGMTIPLAVLAVQGVLSIWPRPRAAAVVARASALMVVPGTVHRFEVAVNSVRAAGDPYFVFAGEQGALDALESDPRPGGVLAPAYAGHMIPYRTGREVYVGALSWTPGLGAARGRDARAVRGADGARRTRRRSRAGPAPASRSPTAGRGCATCARCSAR